MIVENAGFGAAAAAPIARRVFDYLLAGQWPSEEDMAATREGRSVAPIGASRQTAGLSLANIGLSSLAPSAQSGTPTPPNAASSAAPSALTKPAASGPPQARSLP